jgi:phosphocarrier protein
MEQTTESERHERMVEVINKMGIHARPAAMIVRIANKDDAEVYVERDGELVNGKSIMGLMMLAAGQGSRLKFIASGTGAEKLLYEMDKLFRSQFNEG